MAVILVAAQYTRQFGPVLAVALARRPHQLDRLADQEQEKPTRGDGYGRDRKDVDEVDRVGEAAKKLGAEPCAQRPGQGAGEERDTHETAAALDRNAAGDQILPGGSHDPTAETAPGIADQKYDQSQGRGAEGYDRGEDDDPHG